MTTPQHLQSLSCGTSLYMQVPGQQRPWRFTKVTVSGWKRTDGMARPHHWLDHDQLAALGKIVDPPWKEKPDDGHTGN